MDNTDYSSQPQVIINNPQPQYKKYKFKQDQHQVDKKKLQQLNHKQLILDDGDYYFDDMPSTFNKLQTLQIEFLDLDGNQQTQIIWTLMTPRFTHLKHLDLDVNNITNIEALQFLNCELLQFLILDNNNICSFKPLQKTKWDHFKSLSFLFNFVNQFQIGKFKMSSTLKKLNRSYNFRVKTLVQQNISYLAKLQAQDFSYVNVLNFGNEEKKLKSLQSLKRRNKVHSQI